MRTSGILLVLAVMGVPAYWFTELSAQHSPTAMISQYLGATAIVAMAIAQLLATRLVWLERIFGPLDRMYVLHKWLGIGAVAALVLHDAIGAKAGRSGPKTFLSNLGKEMGEQAYHGLLILVAASLITLIPYRLWYWSHKLIGAVFAVGVLHFALVRKPFPLSEPVAIYVLSFGAFGIACWLYALLPLGRNLARYRYRVSAVEPAGSALAVTLAPLRRGLRHAPGQFAFLSLDVAGMRETHPFTISSAPVADATLRFSIKPLGDYTSRLRSALAVGQVVRVSGPHGRFLMPAGPRTQVWIAGGIGVAPFVAWAGALPADAGPIRMLYCVRGHLEAAHLEELRAVARRVPGFELHLVDTTVGARLDAGRVAAVAGSSWPDVTVSYCGPRPMREALHRDLAALGLRRGRFRFEEFEIRTSIWPLEPLLAYVRRWLGSLGTGVSHGSRQTS